MEHAQPSNLQTVMGLLERIESSPADAIGLLPEAIDEIRRLPPAKGATLTRPVFDPGTLFTLGLAFQDVDLVAEAPPEVIRVQHDSWIRGVVSVAFQRLRNPEGEPIPLATLNLTLQGLQALCASEGTANRYTFETNWRVDARQGFISTGAAGEILAPATLVTGDGFYVAPLDWRLQNDQTIEVRIRSILGELVGGVDNLNGAIDVPLIVVAYWTEEMKQRSTG